MQWNRLARTRRFIIGALSIWLAACGGGSSSGGGSTPDVKMVERTPGAGADDADPNAAIVARFNTPLRASTVNESTFILNSGDGFFQFSGLVDYDSADNEVSFTPIQPLDFLTTYRARLLEGIETADGRPVPPSSWPFKTRDGTWGERQDLPQCDKTASTRGWLNVATQEDGTAWGIWREESPASSVVCVSRRSPPVGWEAPVVLDKQPSRLTNYKLPTLAFDMYGRGMAVWNSAFRPMASFWDGSAWSEPELVSPEGESASFGPLGIMDRFGTAMVLWVRPDLTLRARRHNSDFGVGWAEPEDVARDVNIGDLVADQINNGQVQLLFGRGRQLWAQGSLPRSWEAPVLLDEGTPGWNSSIRDLKLALNPRWDGRTVAIWSRFEYQDDIDGAHFGDIRTAVHYPGDDGGWRAMQVVETWPVVAESPTVTADPDGSFMLGYFRYAPRPDGTHDVGVVERRLAKGEDTWSDIHTVEARTSHDVSFAIDEKGRALAAWVISTVDGSSMVRAGRLADREDEWSEPVVIDSYKASIDCQFAMLPTGLTLLGRALLVCSDSKRGMWSVPFE